MSASTTATSENTARVFILLSESANPLTAHSIAVGLGLARSDVNHILYRVLQAQKKVESIPGSQPPLWQICKVESKVDDRGSNSKAKTEEKKETWVFIDLGNVHDCLENMVFYAQNDASVKVHAYADVSFKGYGINPVPPAPVVVHRATSKAKNAADVDMIWDMSRISATQGCRKLFIIATNDHGFASLAEKLKQDGHEAVFVTKWDELRIYVE